MTIECEGAPRDLGLDQGRAIGEGVDAELARILREQPVGTATLALGRDVERHFPHLAERMAGLARGARVERTALVVALARTSREPGFLLSPARAVGLAPPAAPRTLLGGRFDLSADRCSMPIVRRSRPQGGFPSAELTLPWLASSLAGVNTAGLAVMLAPPGLSLLPGEGQAAEARCRAPAMLFVQQCLERFDRVETAMDWCLSRPSDGSASLLFADASGALAGLALDEDRRRPLLLSPSGLLWRTAGGDAPPALDASRVELASDASSLPGLLADGGGEGGDPLAHRAYAWLDPAARTLAVVLDPEGLAPPHVERVTADAAPERG